MRRELVRWAASPWHVSRRARGNTAYLAPSPWHAPRARLPRGEPVASVAARSRQQVVAVPSPWLVLRTNRGAHELVARMVQKAQWPAWSSKLVARMVQKAQWPAWSSKLVARTV